MKVHILMCSFNRRELTLFALKKAYDGGERSNWDLRVTLVDDGSTDGTSVEVAKRFPNVEIVRSENLYWASSMALAERSALALSDNDYFLWLNDDVDLHDDWALRAAKWIESQPSAVIVGPTCEPERVSEISYTGYRRPGRNPLRINPVAPNWPDGEYVDTFNGNFVLVPYPVACSLGGIERGFAHAFADLDYGYRCRSAGVKVWLAPETVGSCPRNPRQAKHRFLTDLRTFAGPKGGGNLTSLSLMYRRHGPKYWPFIILRTYAAWLLRWLFGQRSTKATP